MTFLCHGVHVNFCFLVTALHLETTHCQTDAVVTARRDASYFHPSQRCSRPVNITSRWDRHTCKSVGPSHGNTANPVSLGKPSYYRSWGFQSREVTTGYLNLHNLIGRQAAAVINKERQPFVQDFTNPLPPPSTAISSKSGVRISGYVFGLSWLCALMYGDGPHTPDSAETIATALNIIT